MLPTSSEKEENSSAFRFENFDLVYGSGLFITHFLYVGVSVFDEKQICLPRQEPIALVNRKPMLTIFAIPKAFRGHIATIQRNAITSWTMLRPRPEILLFGNESGTQEICLELGLQQIPEVSCTANGAPLLRDLFRKAQRASQNDLLCYVNADIILLRDFSKALQEVSKLGRKFLMVARRWDIFLNRLWDFASDQAEQELREYVLREGKQGPLPGTATFSFSPVTFGPRYPILPSGGEPGTLGSSMRPGASARP